MNNKIESLIKESFKDIAIRLCDINYQDRKSLLAEYKEWIISDINFEEILMLPYEAYTHTLETEFNDENL
tara:strand:+ start:1118 stop:1327 length:210 start_codon:yes stop_codon:yes gene_type:complete